MSRDPYQNAGLVSFWKRCPQDASDAPASSPPPAFVGHIGLARLDITPPAGIDCRNWGAAPHDVARGIHRPLWLTALSLTDAVGGEPLVLVEADLGWWASPARERTFRAGIVGRLGLAVERFLFAVTHTHSAPPPTPPEPHWPGGDLLAAFHATIERAAEEATRCTFQPAFTTNFAEVGM